MPVAERSTLPVGCDEASSLLGCLRGLKRIALAVSGGRDSMALVRLVHRWAEATGKSPQIVVLTVDHRLRAGSTEEARQVADWCAALGLDHCLLEWTGPKPATRIQERAREARYGLLTDWCRANGADALATAHHLDDQAETVLMRLARASGPDGLTGIAGRSEWRGVPILRPLLSVPRSRLTATLESLGQDWIDDPANADPVFERARLRRQWPALAECGLSAASIAASAAKIARAVEAIDVLTARVMARAVAVEPTGFARVDRSALSQEPEEIRRRVIAMVLGMVGGGRGPSGASLDRAVRRVAVTPTAGFTLAGCRIADAGDALVVARELRGLPCSPLEPGDTVIWDDRFAVSLGRRRKPMEIRALGAKDFAVAQSRKTWLATVPKLAGSALPGGYVDGELAHVPAIGGKAGETGFAARFVRVPPGVLAK